MTVTAQAGIIMSKLELACRKEGFYIFTPFVPNHIVSLGGWMSGVAGSAGLWKDIIWDKDAAERVFYYCGGHPLVSRNFASMACEQGSRKQIDLLQVENTARSIRKTFHKNEIGNYYNEGVWALLHEKEKNLLALVCNSQDQNLQEQLILLLK